MPTLLPTNSVSKGINHFTSLNIFLKSKNKSLLSIFVLLLHLLQPLNQLSSNSINEEIESKQVN